MKQKPRPTDRDPLDGTVSRDERRAEAKLTLAEQAERMRAMYTNQIHGMPRVRVPLSSELRCKRDA